MKEIPSYLIKLVKEFNESTEGFDCLIESKDPLLKFEQAQAKMKEKALAVAFAMSCELWDYCKE